MSRAACRLAIYICLNDEEAVYRLLTIKLYRTSGDISEHSMLLLSAVGPYIGRLVQLRPFGAFHHLPELRYDRFPVESFTIRNGVPCLD